MRLLYVRCQGNGMTWVRVSVLQRASQGGSSARDAERARGAAGGGGGAGGGGAGGGGASGGVDRALPVAAILLTAFTRALADDGAETKASGRRRAAPHARRPRR